MAEDDEYELLPRHEIETLKKEVERLKKNPLGELPEGENFLDAINNLNDNIKKLIDIFTKAGADLEEEGAGASAVEDLQTIKDQNEQIAQGVVTVADMVKNMKESAHPQPLSHEPRIPVPYTDKPAMPAPVQGPLTGPASAPEGLPPVTGPLPRPLPGPLPDFGSENQPPAMPPVQKQPPPKRRKRFFSRK